MKTIRLIAVSILLGLMASCQFEIPHEDDPTCKELIDNINNKYDEKISELYNSCPDKCDYSAEIKVIEKKRWEKLNKLNCK